MHVMILFNYALVKSYVVRGSCVWGAIRTLCTSERDVRVKEVVIHVCVSLTVFYVFPYRRLSTRVCKEIRH